MLAIDQLKFNLRESNFPYFSDSELSWLLEKNGDNVNAASYEGLRMKAEDDSIKLSGMDIPSSQKYFLKLAKQYRPNHSGAMQRVDGR